MSPARRIGWQAAGHRLGEGRVDGQHAMNAGGLEDAPHGAIGRDGEPQLHLARASSMLPSWPGNPSPNDATAGFLPLADAS